MEGSHFCANSHDFWSFTSDTNILNTHLLPSIKDVNNAVRITHIRQIRVDLKYCIHSFYELQWKSLNVISGQFNQPRNVITFQA